MYVFNFEKFYKYFNYFWRKFKKTSNYIKEFLTLLVTCHTVIPETRDNQEEIVYQASSPGITKVFK